MKASLFRSYRMQMMYYTILSAGITGLIDVVIIYISAKIIGVGSRTGNLPRAVGESMMESSQNFRMDAQNSQYMNKPPESAFSGGPKIFGQSFHWGFIVLLLLLSCVLFIAVFHLLTRKMTRYIEEITMAIAKIAQGDFTGRVDVRYENEFSIIAQNLNIMALDLRLLKEKEQEAETTKNELITNVAHDLRTPLTSIIGYLDILNTKEDITDEERKKYIGIAFNKSKRLEALINDLFSFTKLTYGNMPLKSALLDVVKLVEQQIDEFYPTFEENHLICEFKAYETSALVVGDGEMIARAFENLISNAIKYGKNGKIIKVVTKKEGNYIKVTVINYGSVIPKEDLPYIFDRFYRVEQSRQESTGGTGLGLSIAKSIIEKHGGRIEARSSMSGTAFDVYLKLAANPNLTD